ncbi:single-stranded DNA-binding protein [candidate division KSB1 bacterium]|nr:single-stranded DNA-binding protein [candidate division KSB1 bacterium]
MAFDSKGTLNKVMLIGRLGQDPELKYTPTGVAVVQLSIATNTSYRDQDGKNIEQTEWHRVVVWRKAAEMISQYAKKGSSVYVEGRLGTRSWDDKDGNKRYMTEVTANQIQFVGGRSDTGGSPTPPSTPQPPEPDFQEPSADEADDLPF